MPNLYKLSILKRGDVMYARQNFPIFALFNSSVICAVDGVRLLGGRAEPPYEETSFHALIYHTLMQGETGQGKCKKVLYDSQLGIAAEPAIAERQIDVFRLLKPGSTTPHKYIAVSCNAAAYTNHFGYEGTLREALQELAGRESGFRFNFWESAWNPLFLDDGKRTGDVGDVSPAAEGLTLDELFRMIEESNSKMSSPDSS